MRRFLFGTLMLFLTTSMWVNIVFSANVAVDQVVSSQYPGSSPVSLSPNEAVENSILYFITQNDTIWKNGPASFPAGAQYVVLEGNPYEEGPYTIRIKFPPHYKLPAHFHDDLEEMTVISGVIHLAVGDALDTTDGFNLSAGGFTVLYSDINHFIWTEKEGAVIQIHGVGPRTSMYVDGKEDPTWMKHLQSDTAIASRIQKILIITAREVSIKAGRLSALIYTSRNGSLTQVFFTGV